MKNILLLKFGILVLVSISYLKSQNITIPSNASKLLKQTGLSEKQAKDLIKKNNLNSFNEFPIKKNKLSDSEIGEEKLSNQLNELYNKDKSIQLETDLGSLSKDIILNNDDKKNILDVKNLNIDNSGNSQYFGYNIFESNPEIFQKSINESVDPNYIVGPGDEIIIMLWGETEFNSTYNISRDGYLFIENIGQVFVNGLTVQKMEQKLFKLLKKVYSSLGTQKKWIQN